MSLRGPWTSHSLTSLPITYYGNRGAQFFSFVIDGIDRVMLFECGDQPSHHPLQNLWF